VTSESNRQTVRNAVLIGGSGDVGRAIGADLCQDRPTRLLVVYREDHDAAREALAESEAAVPGSAVLAADVTTVGGRAAVSEHVRRDMDGRVDALVYSAVYRGLHPALELPLDEWRLSLEVNATGFIAVVQELAPLMPWGGRVLAVSGISGVKVYSDVHMMMGAAKAALHHSVGYLAMALADQGVNVNCVALGSILSQGPREHSAEDLERFMHGVARSHPKGRLPTPSQLAPVATFLCSPAAEWINGQVIVVDGGQTLAS
jgi:NAD(P)-dependent dehydrogenase (short-subunit alcohol dehydrogenase family)